MVPDIAFAMSMRPARTPPPAFPFLQIQLSKSIRPATQNPEPAILSLTLKTTRLFTGCPRPRTTRCRETMARIGPRGTECPDQTLSKYQRASVVNSSSGFPHVFQPVKPSGVGSFQSRRQAFRQAVVRSGAADIWEVGRDIKWFYENFLMAFKTPGFWALCHLLACFVT